MGAASLEDARTANLNSYAVVYTLAYKLLACIFIHFPTMCRIIYFYLHAVKLHLLCFDAGPCLVWPKIFGDNIDGLPLQVLHHDQALALCQVRLLLDAVHLATLLRSRCCGRGRGRWRPHARHRSRRRRHAARLREIASQSRHCRSGLCQKGCARVGKKTGSNCFLFFGGGLEFLLLRPTAILPIVLVGRPTSRHGHLLAP